MSPLPPPLHPFPFSSCSPVVCSSLEGFVSSWKLFGHEEPAFAPLLLLLLLLPHSPPYNVQYNLPLAVWSPPILPIILFVTRWQLGRVSEGLEQRWRADVSGWFGPWARVRLMDGNYQSAMTLWNLEPKMTSVGRLLCGWRKKTKILVWPLLAGLLPCKERPTPSEANLGLVLNDVLEGIENWTSNPLAIRQSQLPCEEGRKRCSSTSLMIHHKPGQPCFCRGKKVKVWQPSLFGSTTRKPSAGFLVTRVREGKKMSVVKQNGFDNWMTGWLENQEVKKKRRKKSSNAVATVYCAKNLLLLLLYSSLFQNSKKSIQKLK